MVFGLVVPQAGANNFSMLSCYAVPLVPKHSDKKFGLGLNSQFWGVLTNLLLRTEATIIALD